MQSNVHLIKSPHAVNASERKRLSSHQLISHLSLGREYSWKWINHDDVREVKSKLINLESWATCERTFLHPSFEQLILTRSRGWTHNKWVLKLSEITFGSAACSDDHAAAFTLARISSAAYLGSTPMNSSTAHRKSWFGSENLWLWKIKFSLTIIQSFHSAKVTQLQLLISLVRFRLLWSLLDFVFILGCNFLSFIFSRL